MNRQNLDELVHELRQSEPYIDDSGFTGSVLAELPKTRRLPTWVKNLIQLGAVIISSAIFTWQLPVPDLVAQTIALMQNLPFLTAATMLPFLLAYCVIIMSVNDLV